MRRAIAPLVLAIVVLLCLGLPAVAREEIRLFRSDVALLTDGSVAVTEHLDVNAEGARIRHGIFRDIPTVLRNDDGSKFYSALSVLSVEFDGAKAAYSTEAINNGTRIRIGDADSFVHPGLHHYVIRYTMTRMARFFADHDELFWNATGNYWDFPIVAAEATVTLPKGAVISRLVGYTGRPGSTEQAVAITRTADDSAQFRATRELGPGEGMSVALAFQKGIVTPPGGAGQGLDWLSDHRDTIAPAIGALLVLLYNLFAWNAVGRDPKKGTIIPLFHPPEGISPALLHWVHRMGWAKNGWTAITALIFDLGVRGLVTVDNRDKRLSVTAIGDAPVTLPTGESQLNSYLRNQKTLTIDKSSGPDLDRKRREVLAAIEAENRGAIFNLNLGYVLVGVVVAAAVLGIMVWLGVLPPAFLFVAVIGGVVVGVAISLLRGSVRSSPFGFIFVIIWAAMFGLTSLSTVGGLLQSSLAATGPVVGVAAIVLLTVAFGFLMRAPTAAGRKLMDQIDGFIMYLDTAEKQRLNLAGEPPLTIKRFEAILPYAIALGVEKPWTDKFEAALAAGTVADATGSTYVPLWYAGSSFNSNTITSSVAAISTGMSAAMAAAVPSSSSSSGFSGGGGSGGGGGGGGGGGW
jgi:hypothetical protein